MKKRKSETVVSHWKTLLLGLGVVIGATFLIHGLYATVITGLFAETYTMVPWWARQLTHLPIILGGFTVGYRLRKNVWLYGVILALIVKIVSLSTLFIIVAIPHVIFGQAYEDDFVRALVWANIIKSVLSLPVSIILTAAGGYLGLYYRKRQTK